MNTDIEVRFISKKVLMPIENGKHANFDVSDVSDEELLDMFPDHREEIEEFIKKRNHEE